MNFPPKELYFVNIPRHIFKYNFFVLKYFFKITDSAESWDHVLQKAFRIWRILGKLKLISENFTVKTLYIFPGFWLPTWDPATTYTHDRILWDLSHGTGWSWTKMLHRSSSRVNRPKVNTEANRLMCSYWMEILFYY